MSGDVSGDSGPVKFHLTGFPQGASYLGGKTLADIIMAEFERILKKFKSELEADAGQLKALRQLAIKLNGLASLLNDIVESTEKPSEITGKIDGAIKGIVAELNQIFPKSKRSGAYYTSMMDALKNIQSFLKNGGITLVADLAKEEQKLYNWWKKQFAEHGHKGYMSNHKEREALAKQLVKMLKLMQGYISELQTMQSDWNTKMMGKMPEAITTIINDANSYWKAMMTGVRVNAFPSEWKHATIKQYYDAPSGPDIKGLGWWLAAILYVGKYHGKEGHRTHKLMSYDIYYENDMWDKGQKAVEYAVAHENITVSADAIIYLVREMASGSEEGFKLRQDFGDVWASYQEALRSIAQMENLATSLSNQQVGDVYSKSTALQQLTKILSKDLMVPIHAIDLSISRIFG